VIEAIPPGWQYPDVCVAKIRLEGESAQSAGFLETPWVQQADIVVQDKKVGELRVYYTREMPRADDGPFLKEETKLLSTIADRLGHYLLYSRMKFAFQQYQIDRRAVTSHRTEEWRVALNFLRQTNKNLFLNISRRMLNFLTWNGIREAEQLFQRSSVGAERWAEILSEGDNRPSSTAVPAFSDKLADETFKLAAQHLSSEQILSNIQKWIQEDRLSFLVQVTNRKLPLAEVVDAVRRYHHISSEGIVLPPASRRGVLVSLIQRFLSDNPEFINTAAQHLEVDDFSEVLDHVIFSPESQGRLGGKSAGLFLARHVLQKSEGPLQAFGEIKVPKTWYITSDGLLSFLAHNDLNEVVEQKYMDLTQVRLEYPHILQTFRTARFPTDIIQGLSMVLDDFREQPIIVRSSSLLEDRLDSSFSGKYKSLFLANQGTKAERLAALKDAVAEVYASTYGPDPIGYRSERNLLDFPEEMGIMIQSVVGSRCGDYFFPSFAGVAFSRNEFRWSQRIRREDGLLRMVIGLGTRAVDRTGDDYPVLIAPGQVGLRVNVAPEDVIRYAPRKADVLNLKTNRFETLDIRTLFQNCGASIPAIDKIVALFDGSLLRTAVGRPIDFEKDNLVVTFEGLIQNTSFVPQLREVMHLLEDQLQSPVDIEFASNGKDFYLLQCRPQSQMEGGGPASIPQNIPPDRLLFLANRFISNGSLQDITHIVYVDPKSYDSLTSLSDLAAVGRAVGRLNQMLPRRRFILMGPGRWGSRGDIKLGVKVSYADISNTAALVEIARQKGNYVPDLSFGTHFFQDLVEAEIRYLPLYPDEQGTVFQERFFAQAPNILPKLLPEFAFLKDAVKVIDLPASTGGLVLRVLMNADLDEAVGMLVQPDSEPAAAPQSRAPEARAESSKGNHWAWRLEMAQHIAHELDPGRFGVKALYVIGSTKNATAGPESDIDLLVHFVGTPRQRRDLLLWLEGWSKCLDEMNFQRTGVRSGGLLDIHLITDQDIRRRTSYAVKIGATADAARPLNLRT
jgi:pyruvate,water dikinase